MNEGLTLLALRIQVYSSYHDEPLSRDVANNTSISRSPMHQNNK